MAQLSEVVVKLRLHVEQVVPTRNVLLLALQVLAFTAVLVGISFWSVPAALVVGGILAIAACELQSRSSGPSADEVAEQNKTIRVEVDKALANGKNPFSSDTCPITPMWVAYVDAATRNRKAPE